MREKIVLLYEDNNGKILCDVASRVLTAVSLSFGHSFVVTVRECAEEEIDDQTLDVCTEANVILATSDEMECMESLTAELYCNCRVRDLRYDHLIDNRSLMGKDKPLRAVIVQALESEEAALQCAARQANAIAGPEDMPLRPVPPSGNLRDAWQKATEEAREIDVVSQDIALPDVIPALIRAPHDAGVFLCPPYAGQVLAPALAALCGAPSMCFDKYIGGQCPVYVALGSNERVVGEEVNPFGLLRAVERLLREDLNMELEADCVQAAMRNVLQAGWRSPDIAATGMPLLGAGSMAELLCQQIEVAGEWVTSEE